MSDLPRIPIPLKQRWQDFRTQIVPIAVFFGAMLGVFLLWDFESTTPGFPGEAHATFAEVSAPAGGTLVDFSVQPFAHFNAGDIIGYIEIIPDERFAAAIEVLEAEIALLRQGALDPVLDQQRNALNWENLQRDNLATRANLASLRVRKRQAQKDLDRFETLYAQGQIAISELERLSTDYEALKAEITELDKLVQHSEGSIHRTQPGGSTQTLDLTRSLDATLLLYEKRLRQVEADLEPVPIRAPISGTISELWRQSGEYVQAGLPLFTIRAPEPEFIIGYLKMPSRIEPQEGMRIQVQSRNTRQRTEAQVVSVGAQFEPLGPSFASPYALREDRALPIKISLPDDLSLRPGEFVDLAFVN